MAKKEKTKSKMDLIFNNLEESLIMLKEEYSIKATNPLSTSINQLELLIRELYKIK